MSSALHSYDHRAAASSTSRADASTITVEFAGSAASAGCGNRPTMSRADRNYDSFDKTGGNLPEDRDAM